MLKTLFALLTKSNRKTISDEEAVSEYLKTQNNYYYEIIYRRYSPKIFGKCLTLLKDEHLAQDATQDILMKILLSMSKYSGSSKFSTWVYSVTYNFCIDKIRKAKKNKSRLIDDTSMIEDVPDEISDKLMLEVKLENLKRVLDLVPVDDKAILMMKYMDGLSIREIADIHYKTESAVKMKIKRAKERFLKLHKETITVAL